MFKIEVKVLLADETNKNIIKNIYPLYLHDLSEHYGNVPNEYGIYEEEPMKTLMEQYEVQNVWFERPGILYPFIIMVDEKPAGFMLTTRFPIVPSKEVDYYVCEFFILRPYRRKNIGQIAAKQVFDKFLGTWELYTNHLEANIKGQKFWRRTIGEYTNNNYEEFEGDTWDGQRLVFRFSNSVAINEELLDKYSNFQYTALRYVDVEELEEAKVYICEEDKLFIYKILEDKVRIYWTAYSKGAMLDGINRTIEFMNNKKFENKKLYIEFVPPEFEKDLEVVGFNNIGEFRDYWNRDINALNFKDRTSAIKIRKLKIEEYEKAAGITRSCKGYSRGFTGETNEFVKEWMERENSFIFGAFKDEKMVAVAFINFYGFESEKGTVLWLRELAVEPSYHNKGIGDELLKTVIKFGQEFGAKRGFLACDKENYNAIKLYEKLGYEVNENECQINMER